MGWNPQGPPPLPVSRAVPWPAPAPTAIQRGPPTMDHQRDVAHGVPQHGALEGVRILAHQVAREEAAV